LHPLLNPSLHGPAGHGCWRLQRLRCRHRLKTDPLSDLEPARRQGVNLRPVLTSGSASSMDPSPTRRRRRAASPCPRGSGAGSRAARGAGYS
jgi:hypothetical protein